jgi:hypothetical protein
VAVSPSEAEVVIVEVPAEPPDPPSELPLVPVVLAAPPSLEPLVDVGAAVVLERSPSVDPLAEPPPERRYPTPDARTAIGGRGCVPESSADVLADDRRPP